MPRGPRYSPGQFPGETKDREFGKYVEKEFEQIARTFEGEQDALLLTPLSVEPDKPRAGMVVYATATWSPDGSGAGFFGYHGGAWVRLG